MKLRTLRWEIKWRFRKYRLRVIGHIKLFLWPYYRDVSTTSDIGMPMRTFDGNGVEVVLPVATNMRTGWVRCHVVRNGEHIFTKDESDSAIVEQYVPLPISMTPYRKEDTILEEQTTNLYPGYKKITDW